MSKYATATPVGSSDVCGRTFQSPKNTPYSETGIPADLERLDKAIGALHESVGMLRSRLGFVSLPDAPEPIATFGEGTEDIRSGVSSRLSSAYKELSLLDREITRLARNLDL